MLLACFAFTSQQFCLEQFWGGAYDIFFLIVIHVGDFLFQSPSDLYTSCGAGIGTKDY